MRIIWMKRRKRILVAGLIPVVVSGLEKWLANPP
jgi:hypothetical protein